MSHYLKVEVISIDTVTPSRPTPPNHKTKTLSFLDESFPPVHVSTLLIYTSDKSGKTPLDNVTNLKNSLSENLNHYYPLAGRLENDYTVSCNDEGVPFIATRVNRQLKEFMNSPTQIDTFTKFFPPEDMMSFGQFPISTVIPLIIQVNFFECGGIAIGCCCIHKLFDGFSMSSFLDNWAARASGRYEDLVNPDFDTTVNLFPSLTKEKRDNIIMFSDAKAPVSELSQQLNIPINVVAKSFKFNNKAIKQLKANAASKTVPNPTSFEVVSGFVWKHALDAVLHDNNATRPILTVLTISTGLRFITTPPLSKHCIGNITTTVDARAGDQQDSHGDHTLHEMVREIHAAVQTRKQKLETLLGENGWEILITKRNGSSNKDQILRFTMISWYKLFSEVNFGFGKATKVIPLNKVYPFLRNTMILLDYTDSNGDGIQVYVCLEQNQMSFLEDTAEFMAFATSS